MHMLLHTTPPDYDSWRSEFEGDADQRMEAGLTVLQLWRSMDGDEVSILIEANDRKRAEAWLKTAQAGGPTIDARFLKVA